MAEPYVPPPYPYDRLDPIKAIANDHEGGVIDLSIGTPCDPPPDIVIEALGTSGLERGYPPSVGLPEYREAASGWLARRFGISVPAAQVAATVGTKEFVAGTPNYLKLRMPDRDTVLYPEISYPTYAMGATLAGCRAVPVPLDENFAIDLSRIDPADAARALCLWVNTPGNPAGALDDLEAAAEWGRANDVLVISDECYIEFTWDGRPRSILEYGTEGVLALHSLSKRSNMAGTRAGFYAGDADLVRYLSEVRKHGGFLVPGPVQAAAIAAFDDDAHVEVQRRAFYERMELAAQLFTPFGLDVSMPAGGFYLWVHTGADAWELTRKLAETTGALVSPGEFYGPAGADFVRVAAVQPIERIQAAVDRR